MVSTTMITKRMKAIAARTQPQLDVLDHADVFVTHAGMGSAAESLWFGVPTVAIPQVQLVGKEVQHPAHEVAFEPARVIAHRGHLHIGCFTLEDWRGGVHRGAALPFLRNASIA